MMKKLFTLILAAACSTATAQVEFPWNPDSNGDGEIGVDDLLGMLASFGESWELPDPTTWAGETVLNLLGFEAELDSLAMAQAAELSNIQVAIEQLQAIGDSLQSSGNTCYAFVGGAGPSPTASTPIPTSCRHVNIYTGYGSGLGWPVILPIEGEFVGHTISFFLMPYGNAYHHVPIQPHPNDALSDGTTLFPLTSSLNSNWSSGASSNIHKKFVWDGFRWELVSEGAVTLSTNYD